jgi:hypothetical protein
MRTRILCALLLLVAAAAAAQSPRITDIVPTTLRADTPGRVLVYLSGIFPGCANQPVACPPGATIDGVQADVVFGQPGSTNVIAVSVPPHARGSSKLVVTDSAGHSAQTTLRYVGTNPLDDYEQVLVPITSTEISGANGSHWVSETYMENTSAEFAEVQPPYYFAFSSPPGYIALHLTPGFSMHVPPVSVVGTPEGQLLGVPRWLGRKIAFNSRVQDTSRQSQTWGTEIPIVRENEFADSITLINVPGDARYRLTLRIYSRTSAADVRVRADVLSALVPIIDPPIVGPLFERVVHVGAPIATYDPNVNFGYPGYATVTIGNYGLPLQITVTSESGAPNNIWAFVSITNNETQNVTIVTPR